MKLLLLPTELIAHVLSLLDSLDVLRCALTCKSLREITRTASIHYALELDAMGLQNGPPNPALSSAARLGKLLAFRRAWNNGQWTESKVLPMDTHNVWEMSGGVLAQGMASNGACVALRQLQSKIRDIEEREWTVDLGFHYKDFTINADLLVAIEARVPPVGEEGGTVGYVHLLSASTGTVHPLASLPRLQYTPEGYFSEDWRYSVLVSGVNVGVMYALDEDAFVSPKTELMVWNWQTGEPLLKMKSTDMSSFTFIADDLVLIGTLRDDCPRLEIHEFPKNARPSGPPSGFVKFYEPQGHQVLGNWCPQPHIQNILNLPPTPPEVYVAPEYLIALEYPLQSKDTIPLDMEISMNPPLGFVPPQPNVPFFDGPDHRVITSTVWANTGRDHESSTVLFITLPNILEWANFARGKIDYTTFELPYGICSGVRGMRLLWPHWGVASTRLLKIKPSLDWVCTAYGMKYIIYIPPKETEEGQEEGPKRSARIELFDFNPISVMRRLDDKPKDARTAYITSVATVDKKAQIFEEPVSSGMPCRMRIIDVPPLEMGPVEAVMLSSDSIVLISDSAKKFGILTF